MSRPKPLPAVTLSDVGEAPDADPLDDTGEDDYVCVPPSGGGGGSTGDVEVVDTEAGEGDGGGGGDTAVADQPPVVLPDCDTGTSYLSHCGGTGEYEHYVGLDERGVPRPSDDQIPAEQLGKLA